MCNHAMRKKSNLGAVRPKVVVAMSEVFYNDTGFGQGPESGHRDEAGRREGWCEESPVSDTGRYRSNTARAKRCQNR
jgi:hypothetical protein